MPYAALELTDIIAIELICDVIYVGGSILTNVILHSILLEKIRCASEQGVNICGSHRCFFGSFVLMPFAAKESRYGI